ncbi:hypothetical protein BD324DRAFT_631765 [Kockovaella imperatae]|uniref:Uncharacterized protein n=1 Tax=Kockovaella imperatae TaxID=4999 RepID=A0A1Y1UCM4_9TREE|nr:hypothetical protein BD324DRAFT_631765 [Kockovaella imperatae]ORX35801.1 hypothetical protein BD324DRAFT_631765 [Kockovaella imperatae]
MDEDLDPDWREIVNSLNQASQSNDIHHRDALHPSETNSHEASHLAEHEERDRIEQSLQNTLEHFTEANLSDLFPGNFGQSPPAHFDLSTGEASQPIASSSSITHTIPSSGLAGDSSTIDAPPFEVSVKRGRGRPKGSKNKYKAVTKPRKPRRKKTPPPKRPRGRPPKVRDPDEQAEYEASRARKELGIAKRKGRPRKFPGYLVREMRLRKNREEYIRLLREYEENHPEGQEPPEDPDGGVDDDIRMEVVPTMDEGYQAEDEVRRALEGQAFNLAASGMDGQPSGDVQPDVSGEGGVESIFANAWEPHGQSLLEVVDAAAAAEAARRAEEEEEEQEPVEGEENMPSGHDSQAVEDMKRVFRLDGGDGEEGIDMGMGLGEV